MKRSRELAPLSRDHHVALEHALRLRRAREDDVVALAADFLAFLLGPGRTHFAQEEALLVPEMPDCGADLAKRMCDEHAEILHRAELLGRDPRVAEACALGELLTSHVRFEEREVFPHLEAHLPPDRMRELARGLSRA